MDRILLFLEKLPTTKIRILVTVLLIGGTGFVYLYFACHNTYPNGTCINWEPSSNWYIFLSALAGVDVTQFAAKSLTGLKHAQLASSSAPTDETAEPVEPTDSTATTDVSEIQTTLQEQKG